MKIREESIAELKAALEELESGEGLAMAVVVRLHRLLDRLGDLIPATEHIDDGVDENRAGDVVRVLCATLAAPIAPVAELVIGAGGMDFVPRKSPVLAEGAAGDVVTGLPRLCELHERLESLVVSVDVECHGFVSFAVCFDVSPRD